MTTSAPLLQCPRCGWYTRQLQPDGRCLDCTLGWTQCPQHARLEWAGTDHRRVTATEILTTIRHHQQQQPPHTSSAGPRGARGPG